MSPSVRLLSVISLIFMSAHASAQSFDLRDVGNTDRAAETNALDRYLYSTSFKNPVGNYVSIDEWKEMEPVVSDEGALRVARSLIQAARHESDAKALSSVLAAYRVGADKELIELPKTGPTITLGGANADRERENQPVRSRKPPLPDSALPPPIDQADSDNNGEDESASQQPKIAGLESNPRLGARIVSNLATFRSCSGALVKYLDHLGSKDVKTLAWTRMIRRSMGVAALPPDDSCLSS